VIAFRGGLKMERCVHKWPNVVNAGMSSYRTGRSRYSVMTDVKELFTVASTASKRSRKLRSGGTHGSMAMARRKNDRGQAKSWLVLSTNDEDGS
jgi:hypothetical protein